ncbi:hypothetical protein [Actinoallomurus rhizosphaericola]|uniref:hypothetical protein n=1 Tax=Actinoallomurus rhizosphaericola TaxID=2952536 RepID=UPI0020920392|nr:hypothetical protein [Actinoallomurus rhizosphaericola]MCO5997587.1 hypothetical protein [Actinoallomurus rhizosphaericola]
MTANKNFKRRVRERARRTGESYTAALRHLRRTEAEEQSVEWQRIEKPDFGYAVQVPRDWQEREPNLRNSPWETARFVDPRDRRHSLIVFRQPTRPGRSAAEIAEGVRHSLAQLRFADFAVSEVTVAGRAGTRLDCVRHDAGRSWHVSEYFVVEDAVTFCLGCGSTVPDEDEALFAAMAERLELLDRN